LSSEPDCQDAPGRRNETGLWFEHEMIGPGILLAQPASWLLPLFVPAALFKSAWFNLETSVGSTHMAHA